MTTTHRLAPRGRIRADLVYLGWQQRQPMPDPGPPPQPPAPAAAPETVSTDWAAAQWREHDRLGRGARRVCALAITTVVAASAAWLSGALSGSYALLVSAAALAVATTQGRSLLRGRQVLAASRHAEARRVAAFAEAQRQQRTAELEQHAREFRDWRQRAGALRRQPEWYPVTVPTSVHRIDVAGGTLAGWSALLTMIAAPRLAAGGDVTVLDLTEGGVATDLLAVARRSGISPAVWVLPADLPRLDLGTQLRADVLADVLAQTVTAAGGPGGAGGPSSATAPGGADLVRDAALIGGVLEALGPGATMPQVVAGLRALGQLGGPAEHLGVGGLARDQLARLANLAGRSAGHLVTERAWSIEARLRVLAPLATAPSASPPSRLQVAWLDRRAASVTNAVLAAYLITALTAGLRQAPPTRRWQQAIFVLGTERLPGAQLDQLADATEIAGAGLVLCYRSIPAHVRERLGRGDAAVAFMRLGNADDARVAAEHIGTEHKFVVSQLTDTVGTSVTDTIGVSYTSTVGTSDSVTASDSVTWTSGRSQGRSRPGAVAPVADVTGSASRDLSSSSSACDSGSITAGISDGTSWGWSTSRALGSSDSAARTVQRSRESLVEQHELQQLPQSAVLLCYPAPTGRRVVLADANPAIMALPTATLAVRHPADDVQAGRDLPVADPADGVQAAADQAGRDEGGGDEAGGYQAGGDLGGAIALGRSVRM